ncbi:hypothetical protein V5O48_009317 [Marasmius crinis-equi]|uniref:Uncharacterized protein n=1 Tax=Marasmius crinis-equi TaxID=585013 RepID=A0ABR3FBF5_9AGAR
MPYDHLPTCTPPGLLFMEFYFPERVPVYTISPQNSPLKVMVRLLAGLPVRKLFSLWLRMPYKRLGWANITGQVTLVCGIDFTCAQMIATAIAVSTDGATVLSAGATYGILLAILFTHGIVCSAATRILAQLNLFYTVINVGATVAAIIALLVVSGDNKVSTRDAFLKYENNSGWQNSGWAFLLSFTSPMWTLTGYDSAAHISEEVAGAARAAPIAILVGVGATASLGWILLIATSFVITSVTDLLTSELPLPMGQVFLNVLGKRGMLAIWSMIIVVQVRQVLDAGIEGPFELTPVY